MKILKPQNPPLCECNCGQTVERSKLNGQWNKYVHGHNVKSPNNNGKFKIGNKFGKGGPEGSRNKVSVNAMNLLKDEEQALSRKAIESALDGNTQMLQFCLSRILPPPPKDVPVRLEGMPKCKDIASSIDLSEYILNRLADGSLTPTQASLISGIVERHIRCLQVTDIEERLAAIEDRLENNS